MGVFYEAEWQNHETGAVVDTPEASGGRVVAGRPGAAAGFLTFGPYRPLPAGAYVARFRVRGSGLRLDVTSNFGERVLAERAVDPGPDWVDEVLPFRVEHARPLEFRVAWDGRREAAVDWVLVVAADRPEVERTYEVEALPHRLGERADPAASGGWAAYADPVESLRGDLVGGPARLFPAGRYQLALRLRAAGVGRGPLVASLGHGARGADPGRARGGSGRGAARRLPGGDARLHARSPEGPRVSRRLPR